MADILQTKIDNFINVGTGTAFAGALQTNTNLLLQIDIIRHSIKGTSHQTKKIVDAINNNNVSEHPHTGVSSSPIPSNNLYHSSQYEKFNL